MKKSIIILAAMLAVAAVSCKKETELPQGGPATYRIATRSETELGTLMLGKSVSVTCYATTTDTGVREQLTATFKAMPDAAAPYLNDTTEVLPMDCYAFSINDVVIDRYNKDSRTGELKITYSAGLEGGKAYVLPVALAQVSGSENASADPTSVIVIRFYAKKSDTSRPQGSGTQFDPYLIYDADGLKEIPEKTTPVKFSSKDEYLAATATYFKLANDIDLGGADWTPIPVIMEETECQKFDFDGNGKTISNFKAKGDERVGLFDNIAGSVHDLRVTGAEIIVSGKKAGIIAGQASTKNYIWTTITRCYVQGKVSCPNPSGVDDEVSLGGVLGQQCFGDIYECESDVTIELGGYSDTDPFHYVGGIVGSFGKKALVISNCISRGNYYSLDGSNSYMFGGILGCTQNRDNLLENCISLAKINSYDMAGGIIGALNSNNKTSTASDVTSVVRGCIAWNEEISISNADPWFGTGGIVGWGGAIGVQNCYTKPELGFQDQGNASAGDDSVTEARSYNGNTAPAGKTASQLAKEIGWDETIWDLSGDVPALKCFQ